MPGLIPYIPLLHGGTPPTGGWYTHWVLEPSTGLYLFAVTALYLLWVGPLNRRRPGSEQRPVQPAEIRFFLLGSLSALVALGPPIDDWAGFFFVSAHMLQHLILMFVTAPLWLLGIPAWVYQPILDRPVAGWVFRKMFSFVPAFFISSMLMVIWHIPGIYDAAVRNNVIHAIQHQGFLLAGVFMFWPLVSKVPEAPQLTPPLKCLYIFLLTLPSGIIGAFITYAGPGLYSAYDDVGWKPWGMGVKTDQELAGLMMWVGMNAVLLIMLTVIFLRWANGQERADREQAATNATARRATPREAAPVVTTAPKESRPA
ncbi:MAG TPA: cytochrome c oxidase assembly protein [Thermomicrobiales bacterium]|nr:cytochrome c oxidase assembly protein [Thermomicrobiales bacterium]